MRSHHEGISAIRILRKLHVLIKLCVQISYHLEKHIWVFKGFFMCNWILLLITPLQC